MESNHLLAAYKAGVLPLYYKGVVISEPGLEPGLTAHSCRHATVTTFADI